MKSNNLTGGAGNLICVALTTFTHNEVPLQLHLDRLGMVNRNTLSLVEVHKTQLMNNRLFLMKYERSFFMPSTAGMLDLLTMLI